MKNCSTQCSVNKFLCAGDVSRVKEEKLAQAARYGAKAVIHNVRAMLFGWDKLNTYTPRDLPMIISLGKYDAVSIWRVARHGAVLSALHPAAHTGRRDRLLHPRLPSDESQATQMKVRATDLQANTKNEARTTPYSNP